MRQHLAKCLRNGVSLRLRQRQPKRLTVTLVGALAVVLTGCSKPEEPKAEEKPVEAPPVAAPAPEAAPAPAADAAAAPAADPAAPAPAAQPEAPAAQPAQGK